MDISEIVSSTFTEFDVDTPLSTVAGAFENQELDAVGRRSRPTTERRNTSTGGGSAGDGVGTRRAVSSERHR
jgi:hypothetical protein